MTLSKHDGNVAWELNELLAADRRARAFSESTVEGRDGGSPGFETMHWEQIGKETLEKALLAEQAAQASLSENTDSETAGEEEAAETPAPFDLEAELQARYEEGIEEGKRLSEASQQSQQAMQERLIEALAQHFAALPAVWPIITDLALDIANTVCLQSLKQDPDLFKAYVLQALESAELPRDLPIEVRLSEGTASLVDQEMLTAKFPEQAFTIVADAKLADGDISIAYDQVTVDRLLEREFEQLREQLIAQFPDQNRPV
jgi:flagellar biosynthesis/type III secretory pathway protein FliH